MATKQQRKQVKRIINVVQNEGHIARVEEVPPGMTTAAAAAERLGISLVTFNKLDVHPVAAVATGERGRPPFVYLDADVQEAYEAHKAQDGRSAEGG